MEALGALGEVAEEVVYGELRDNPPRVGEGEEEKEEGAEAVRDMGVDVSGEAGDALEGEEEDDEETKLLLLSV